MLYLFGKIFIFLLTAAGLGFIAGWYLRQLYLQKETTVTQMNGSKNEEYISTLQAENIKLKQQLASCLETAKNRESGPINFSGTEPSSEKIVKDDLKEIRGIGTFLEIKLNQSGIYTFEQIAEWDKNDVDKMLKNLYPYGDRIERDNWIIQAKELS